MPVAGGEGKCFASGAMGAEQRVPGVRAPVPKAEKGDSEGEDAREECEQHEPSERRSGKPRYHERLSKIRALQAMSSHGSHDKGVDAL